MPASEPARTVPETIFTGAHGAVVKMTPQVVAEGFHRAVSPGGFFAERRQKDRVQVSTQALPQPVRVALTHLADGLGRDTPLSAFTLRSVRRGCHNVAGPRRLLFGNHARDLMHRRTHQVVRTVPRQ